MRNLLMSVKDYAEYKMKKENIEERKTALQDQHDDVNNDDRNINKFMH